MSDKPPVQTIQATTEEALVAGARHAALATLAPEDGAPMASRVALASGADGVPFVLVSGLSPHTAALRADPRCSLLIGEPGKGDPLAHARVTLTCRAEELPRSDRLRSAFLATHPKAALYIDLPDFAFFAMRPEAVSYVAGFGRAYRFDGAALLEA